MFIGFDHHEITIYRWPKPPRKPVAWQGLDRRTGPTSSVVAAALHAAVEFVQGAKAHGFSWEILGNMKIPEK